MIRRATSADVDRLVEMAMHFIGESEYKDRVGAKPEALAYTVNGMLSTDKAVILVSESDKGLTGMLGAVLYDHPFSGDLTASELAWWVEPGKRGEGIRLLRAAEKWAREAGATRIQMVSPNKRVAALYRRIGYTELETVFQGSL